MKEVFTSSGKLYDLECKAMTVFYFISAISLIPILVYPRSHVRGIHGDCFVSAVEKGDGIP